MVDVEWTHLLFRRDCIVPDSLTLFINSSSNLLHLSPFLLFSTELTNFIYETPDLFCFESQPLPRVSKHGNLEVAYGSLYPIALLCRFVSQCLLNIKCGASMIRELHDWSLQSAWAKLRLNTFDWIVIAYLTVIVGLHSITKKTYLVSTVYILLSDTFLYIYNYMPFIWELQLRVGPTPSSRLPSNNNNKNNNRSIYRAP